MPNFVYQGMLVFIYFLWSLSLGLESFYALGAQVFLLGLFLFSFYVWFYDRQRLELSFFSWLFFVLHLAILSVFFLGIYRGYQEPLRLEDRPWWAYLRVLMTLLLLFWTLYRFWFPPKPNLWTRLLESFNLECTWVLHSLEGPNFITFVQPKVLQLIDSPDYQRLWRRLHLLFFYVIPMFQVLLLIYGVVYVGHLALGLKFLPLSLLSWFYHRCFHYIQHFFSDNMEEMLKYVGYSVVQNASPESPIHLSLTLKPFALEQGYDETTLSTFHNNLWQCLFMHHFLKQKLTIPHFYFYVRWCLSLAAQFLLFTFTVDPTHCSLGIYALLNVMASTAAPGLKGSGIYARCFSTSHRDYARAFLPRSPRIFIKDKFLNQAQGHFIGVDTSTVNSQGHYRASLVFSTNPPLARRGLLIFNIGGRFDNQPGTQFAVTPATEFVFYIDPAAFFSLIHADGFFLRIYPLLQHIEALANAQEQKLLAEKNEPPLDP